MRVLSHTSLIVSAALVWGALFPLAVTGQDSGGVTLEPEIIEIDMLYGGAEVRVEGPVQQGSDIVVIFRGPNTEETFNKKVRAGPIWINSGKVHVRKAPSLFLSYSSTPVGKILPEALVRQYGLLPDAISRQMELDADGDTIDEDVMRSNYLAMKSGIDVYQVHEGGVSIGGQRFSALVDWPRTAPPADYEVSVYECSGKEVLGVRKATLSVVKVGAPQYIYDYSNNRSSIYGVLAVLLALIAGFGIDFLAARIFGGKRGVGH